MSRAVSDVIWDWDLAASTLWWNDGFMTTFGFAPGEIAPSVSFWTGRIHPEDRNRVIQSLQHAIATEAESWTADYRFQRKDGTHAFVQDRGLILRDPAGKAVRMVGGMRDLTEQKKNEAQHLRAQRMESIGTLAGGIAHDLNNVLAPILMSIELLKLESAPDPRRTKILDTIYVSCRRGADLVRQVLSFARGVDGQRVAESGWTPHDRRASRGSFRRDLSAEHPDRDPRDCSQRSPGPSRVIRPNCIRSCSTSRSMRAAAMPCRFQGGILTVRSRPTP